MLNLFIPIDTIFKADYADLLGGKPVSQVDQQASATIGALFEATKMAQIKLHIVMEIDQAEFEELRRKHGAFNSGLVSAYNYSKTLGISKEMFIQNIIDTEKKQKADVRRLLNAELLLNTDEVEVDAWEIIVENPASTDICEIQQEIVEDAKIFTAVAQQNNIKATQLKVGQRFDVKLLEEILKRRTQTVPSSTFRSAGAREPISVSFERAAFAVSTASVDSSSSGSSSSLAQASAVVASSPRPVDSMTFAFQSADSVIVNAADGAKRKSSLSA